MDYIYTTVIISLFISGISTESPLQRNPEIFQSSEYTQSVAIIRPPVADSFTMLKKHRAIETESLHAITDQIILDNQKRAEEAEKQRIAAEEAAREAAREAIRLQQVAETEARRKAQLKAVAVTQAKSYPIKSDWEPLIRARCTEVGCNADQLIRIMYCESGGRSNAANPSGASGLFQFMPNTFRANAVRSGVEGANIWDPYAQIHVATWMFANGQAHQWVCK